MAYDYAGHIPDEVYNDNTLIYYCCQSDGSAGNEIVLPTANSFVLFHHYGVCQRVKEMNARVEVKIHYDDEDFNNQNYCSGDRPDGARVKKS